MAYFYTKGKDLPPGTLKPSGTLVGQDRLTTQGAPAPAATQDFKPIDPREPKEPGEGGTLACVGGICKKVELATPEAIAACSGKNAGDACQVPVIKPVCPGGFQIGTQDNCPPGHKRMIIKRNIDGQQVREVWCCPDEDDDGGGNGEDCEGGYKLSDQPITGGGGKIWTDTVLNSSHGWTRDSRAEGHYVYHPEWGYQHITNVHKFVQGTASLVKNTVGACEKGFKKTGEYCCPGGDDDGGGAGLGEYNYPPWLQNMMSMITGRFGEFMNPEKYGFSQEAKEFRFGKNFEKVRGLQRPARESILSNLGGAGMLGTGAETEALNKLAWSGQEGLTDLMRDLFLEEEDKKKEDELGYTSAANQLFGRGLGYEQLLEMINSGRRGERNQALLILLQLLGLMK